VVKNLKIRLTHYREFRQLDKSANATITLSAARGAAKMDDDVLSLMTRCGVQVVKALRVAAITALQAGHSDIGTDDIKQGIVWSGGVGSNVLNKVCEIELIAIHNRGHYKPGLDLDRSNFVRNLLRKAIDKTVLMQHAEVGTEHLLLALVDIDQSSVPDPEAARRLVEAYVDRSRRGRHPAVSADSQIGIQSLVQRQSP
jgi:hypothetical protein